MVAPPQLRASRTELTFIWSTNFDSSDFWQSTMGFWNIRFTKKFYSIEMFEAAQKRTAPISLLWQIMLSKINPLNFSISFTSRQFFPESNITLYYFSSFFIDSKQTTYFYDFSVAISRFDFYNDPFGSSLLNRIYWIERALFLENHNLVSIKTPISTHYIENLYLRYPFHGLFSYEHWTINLWISIHFFRTHYSDMKKIAFFHIIGFAMLSN